MRTQKTQPQPENELPLKQFIARMVVMLLVFFFIFRCAIWLGDTYVP
ncbi:MAG: hypothetical protein KBC62_02345 [Candidatus Pacebacteria bacterium]|nr:hypothetical protein [Candidatus Paceibacterota bacterium]MBP9842823.1 hypothetical protein [Candidatus Paceibacterota bacterium]